MAFRHVTKCPIPTTSCSHSLRETVQTLAEHTSSSACSTMSRREPSGPEETAYDGRANLQSGLQVCSVAVV